jgi:hypothetical protein
MRVYRTFIVDDHDKRQKREEREKTVLLQATGILPLLSPLSIAVCDRSVVQVEIYITI